MEKIAGRCPADLIVGWTTVVNLFTFQTMAFYICISLCEFSFLFSSKEHVSSFPKPGGPEV